MQPTPTTFALASMDLLPGGVFVSGERRRSFSLRPVTGELEMRMAEFPDDHMPLHLKVTELLCASLSEIGGATASRDTVQRMCVADRQFVLRKLLIELGQDDVWLSGACGCGENFDAHLALSQLPVQEAIEYPQTCVQTSVGRLWVRVPEGVDQGCLATAKGTMRFWRSRRVW